MKYMLLGTLFGAVIISPGAYADVLYGLTFSNHQLININQNTASSVLVGTVDGSVGSELAAFNGKLYAFDQTNPDTFRLINPSNAATISSTTAGIDIFGEGGMSFRSDGMAFLSGSEGNSGRLFRCNVTVNNGCSEVGALSISMDGLAFGPGGVLFGLSQSPTGTAQPSLYTVDPVTAAITLIGSTGVSGVNLAGLAFDSVSGKLYAGIGANLYTINTGTGAATLVGATGFSDY